MNRDDPTNPTEQPDPADLPPLKIPMSPRRRWAGLTVYLLSFGSVGAVLVFLLVRLGTSLSIAIGAVVIMIAGMLIMARWAGHNVL